MDTADLHLHSSRSDGEWKPERLVREAAREGLRAIALTDHDTTAGLADAFSAGEEHGVEVIAGVEISTWHENADWHILAYGFAPDDPALTELFDSARDGRRERAERMVARLAEIGRPITFDSVLREAGDGVIGRPHVARALVKSGQAGSVREAFDLWLGDGKPACVEKMRVTPAEGIERVQAAGGVSVAAHPGHYGGVEALEPIVASGLDGVEVEHSLHDEAFREELREFARANDLLQTGGSDFHGPGRNSTVGAVRVPYERVEAIRARISRRAEQRRAQERG